MVLSVCQEKAFAKLDDFMVDDEHTVFLLEGAAGTGKTYCLSIYFNKDSNAHLTTQYIAPTHKAALVLKATGVPAKTVHSFLKYTIKYKENGESFFTPSKSQWKYIGKDIDVIILDEISMIDDNMYDDIIAFLKLNPHLKLILMGDRCQLPPISSVDCVDEDDTPDNEMSKMSIQKLSNFFTHKNMIKHKLTTVQRSKNVDICNLFEVARDYSLTEDINTLLKNIHSLKENSTTDKIKIYTEREEFVKDLIKQKQETESEYPRVICCKNLTVGSYIKQLNDILHPGSPLPYQVDDMIYFTKYFQFNNTPQCDCTYECPYTGNIKQSNFCHHSKFYTSEEYLIKSCKLVECKMAYFSPKGDIRCYELKINYKLHTGKDLVIRQVHEDDKLMYQKLVLKKRDHIKDMIAKEKVNNTDDKFYEVHLPRIIAGKWDEFNAEKNKYNAPFVSSNAITTYKAQGSTYDHVYIDVYDILNTRSTSFLRGKEVYTAITRASKSIAILIDFNNIKNEVSADKVKCIRCKKWQTHDKYRHNKKGVFVKTCVKCSEANKEKHKAKPKTKRITVRKTKVI
jgi:hypothetical protein